MALYEQRAAPWIEAAGDQRRRHLPRLGSQLRRVLPDGDRVQVNHTVDRVMAILQRDPVADGPKIVAQGGNAGRLDAGKDTLHGVETISVNRPG